MKYPETISKNIADNGQAVELVLRIPAELAYFTGHFPETPVLAGVVQVEWVMDFAADYLQIDKKKFTGIKQLKFSQVILPESTVNLTIALEKKGLAFKYYYADDIFSSGKLNVG
jgi:3-hydroxymyristoyl/3-hydroxydecanoyl-(acyl carrier protein) dehydratase